jgi:transposase
MKDQRKAEAIAAQRMQLLSPLLAEGLDAGKARQMKEALCRETGLSERTIRRYLERYRRDGFGGLRPKSKRHSKSAPAIGPEILEQAILLRREVPGRSVAQIIQVLEWEGKVPRGHIKRSSLQEKLA